MSADDYVTIHFPHDIYVDLTLLSTKQETYICDCMASLKMISI